MADDRTIENAMKGDRGSVIALVKKRGKWSADEVALVGRGDAPAMERAMEFVRGLAADAAERKAEREAAKVVPNPRSAHLDPAPMTVVGNHDEGTLAQMRKCLDHDDAVRGALCADGHLGYSQPVGGAVAYGEHISVSGVGYDIACGNMAVRTTVPYAAVKDRVMEIAQQIAANVSFGVGRTNATKVEHALFDDMDAWRAADAMDLHAKARSQLGTVGSGNHYVDLFEDRDDGMVWIGVHFGSRGLGHTLATKYLALGGGRDGIDTPPTLLHQDSDLGRAYLAAMDLSGRFAYAGREWVVGEVLRIIGGEATKSVHNHHNFAWREMVDGKQAWVVRKGCTPAFPGQEGFVGGSMGDDAVILRGRTDAGGNHDLLAGLMHSTVHGAGRVKSRTAAKKEFRREDMDAWLREKGVTVIGGDLDESPMAYRRLNEVLATHHETVEVLHTLRPFAVLMAGKDVADPWKD